MSPGAEAVLFAEALLHIYAKLGVSDRAAAVAEAFNRGLLTPGPKASDSRPHCAESTGGTPDSR